MQCAARAKDFDAAVEGQVGLQESRRHLAPEPGSGILMNAAGPHDCDLLNRFCGRAAICDLCFQQAARNVLSLKRGQTVFLDR